MPTEHALAAGAELEDPLGAPQTDMPWPGPPGREGVARGPRAEFAVRFKMDMTFKETGNGLARWTRLGLDTIRDGKIAEEHGASRELTAAARALDLKYPSQGRGGLELSGGRLGAGTGFEPVTFRL